MNRTQKIALTALAALGVLVLWLAMRNPRPPFTPTDPEHTGATLDECAACHDFDGVYFRGKNHPVGTDCTRCHAPER